MKTNREIVDECNELARTLYATNGYEVPDDYKMYDATHPQEKGAWAMAVYAYDHIEGTDVENALAELEEEDLKTDAPRPQSGFTVWVKNKRTDNDGLDERKDTYDTTQSAKEFATEWVERLGAYDAYVVNAKGVRVFEARKAGVRKLKPGS